MCKEAIVVLLKYHSGIFVEELKKTTKKVTQYSRCQDQDLNRAPSEYSLQGYRSTILLGTNAVDVTPCSLETRAIVSK
jgi:hypothetical protein